VLSLAAGLACAIAPPADARVTTFDRCLSRIMSDVIHFVAKKGQCIRSCEDDVRRGKLASDTRCQAPSTHPPTQQCLLAADERITGSRGRTRRVCQDDEIALFYGQTTTCQGQNQTLDEILACLRAQSSNFVEFMLEQIYRPVSFPICGDGAITQFEQCDPAAFPNGCGFDEICHPDFCFCTFVGCGNGIIDFGEDCDSAAFPNGCSAGEFCDPGCACRPFGSPSAAFLGDPPVDLME
jgi:hypothetical protein